MELPSVILAAIALIGAAGSAMAWFARNRGTGTVRLLQQNIEAYKDSEKLKDARILYLEGQIVGLNETIRNLNQVIKSDKKRNR